jgi:hypothetical protein
VLTFCIPNLWCWPSSRSMISAICTNRCSTCLSVLLGWCVCLCSWVFCGFVNKFGLIYAIQTLQIEILTHINYFNSITSFIFATSACLPPYARRQKTTNTVFKLNFVCSSLCSAHLYADMWSDWSLLEREWLLANPFSAFTGPKKRVFGRFGHTELLQRHEN